MRAESGDTFINESALSNDFSHLPELMHAVKDIVIKNFKKYESNAAGQKLVAAGPQL